MKKVTFTFDDDTVSSLERTAARLSRSKSQIVREAIRAYGETVYRLSDEEREEMLQLFDDLTEKIPDRPRAEVEKELDEARRERRSGGRRSPVEKES